MRALSLYFPLLFCALPILCGTYHIHSRDPDNFIVSTGYEKCGDPVETVPKYGEGFPNNTVVYIDPPVCDTEPTEGVVSGKGGLYITRSKDGKKLIWDAEPYKWCFTPPTIGQPIFVIADTMNHEIWFDSIDDQCIVELVQRPIPGKGDPCWEIDMA